MTEQLRRELGDAVERAETELRVAERYRLSQRQTRSGRAETLDRRGPLEFDESGFPIPQRSPGFVRRVTRLVRPF